MVFCKGNVSVISSCPFVRARRTKVKYQRNSKKKNVSLPKSARPHGNSTYIFFTDNFSSLWLFVLAGEWLLRVKHFEIFECLQKNIFNVLNNHFLNYSLKWIYNESDTRHPTEGLAIWLYKTSSCTFCCRKLSVSWRSLLTHISPHVTVLGPADK